MDKTERRALMWVTETWLDGATVLDADEFALLSSLSGEWYVDYCHNAARRCPFRAEIAGAFHAKLLALVRNPATSPERVRKALVAALDPETQSAAGYDRTPFLPHAVAWARKDAALTDAVRCQDAAGGDARDVLSAADVVHFVDQHSAYAETQATTLTSRDMAMSDARALLLHLLKTQPDETTRLCLEAMRTGIAWKMPIAVEIAERWPERFVLHSDKRPEDSDTKLLIRHFSSDTSRLHPRVLATVLYTTRSYMIPSLDTLHNCHAARCDWWWQLTDQLIQLRDRRGVRGNVSLTLTLDEALRKTRRLDACIMLHERGVIDAMFLISAGSLGRPSCTAGCITEAAASRAPRDRAPGGMTVQPCDGTPRSLVRKGAVQGYGWCMHWLAQAHETGQHQYPMRSLYAHMPSWTVETHRTIYCGDDAVQSTVLLLFMLHELRDCQLTQLPYELLFHLFDFVSMALCAGRT